MRVTWLRGVDEMGSDGSVEMSGVEEMGGEREGHSTTGTNGEIEKTSEFNEEQRSAKQCQTKRVFNCWTCSLR